MSIEKHMRLLTLNDGEHVRVTVTCNAKVGGATRAGVLAVTNQRVAFVSRGLWGTGNVSEFIRLSAVTGVEVQHGVMSASKMEITAGFSKIEAKALKPQEADALRDAIQG